MFWSKIWLFLVALAAAAAMVIALALPKSAHKSRIEDERQRLVVACGTVNILLADKARDDVTAVGNFTRDAGLVSAVQKVKLDGDVKPNESPAKDISTIAAGLMDKVEGHKPKMAMITDAKGRVVTRVGVDDGLIGDTEAGRWLVDDALAGYLRDDLWAEGKGTLYLVAASPIIARSTAGDEIIGSAVLGWQLDTELADGYVAPFQDAAQSGAENRSIHISFFAGDTKVASSKGAATLDTDLLGQYAKVKMPDAVEDDCKSIEPFYASDNGVQYAAVMSRLPGEAEHQHAFFAVYTPRPAEASFGGAVSKAKGELGGDFPWVAVVIIFLVSFAGGVALMIWEADRPLRHLQADAVRLAKGEGKDIRLDEKQHGRFGSIARSVNIAIDKLERDAKAAKKDLDHLLGPAPEGSLGAMDLLGGTPLPARPSIPIAAPAAPSAPPPSEFRFSDSVPAVKKPAAAPELDLGPSKVSVGSPPAAPKPPAAPPPRPGAPPVPPAPPKKALDDDILSFADESSQVQATPIAAPATGGEEAYYREVFEQFLELKKKCGEPTAGLTFAKFGDKLRKNKEELVSKTGCKEVRFTVYVKDGKAALKATPVKD